MNERCIWPGCQARTDAVSCTVWTSLHLGVVLRNFHREGSDFDWFPLYRYCCLTLRIEEWHLHNLRGHPLPDSFNGDLHLQFIADLGVRSLHTGQSDHLLQHRRPRGGSGLAHLPVFRVNRNREARSLAGGGGRESKLFVTFFHFGPVDLEPDQLPWHTALLLLEEGGLADEVFFLEMNHLAKAQLVG